MSDVYAPIHVGMLKRETKCERERERMWGPQDRVSVCDRDEQGKKPKKTWHTHTHTSRKQERVGA